MKHRNCPSTTTRVIDSRTTNDGKRRRRHRCVVCQDRFNTYEISDEHVQAAEDTKRHLKRAENLIVKIADILLELGGTKGFEPAILDAMQEIWIRNLVSKHRQEKASLKS